MRIWVITMDCCDEYVSAWTTPESAQAEAYRLNKGKYYRKASPRFLVEESELNGPSRDWA